MSGEGTASATSTAASSATATTMTTTPEPPKAKRSGSFGFLRSGSKKQPPPSTSTNAEASSSTGNVVRKSKSFKRIRGLLNRGESRKERRERRARERRAARSSTPQLVDQDDDASTVYGVDVDERSLATATATPGTKDAAAAGAKKKTNQNLLDSTATAAAAATKTKTKTSANQNEIVDDDVDDEEDFASSKSSTNMLKVVLLLMDPQTRRFELLQLEFDSQKALVSDVLQQIPVSVTEQALRLQTYTGICGKDGKEMPAQALLATYANGNEVLVAIPSPLAAKESAKLAKPILSDEKVVSMLLSSGIDAKGWREKKKKRKTHHHHKAKGTTATTTTSREEASSTTSSSKSSSSSSSYTFFILVAVVLAIVLQVFHLYISAPIKTGHVLSPGIWLTKCGVLGVLGSLGPCGGGGGAQEQQQQNNNNMNAYLHLNATDGHVRCYNAQQELVWEMEGGVCSSSKDNVVAGGNGESKDACIPGLQVKEDHTLVVGGKPVRTVNVYQDKPKHHHNDDDLFSPWPFAQPPKIKKLYKKQHH